VYTFPPGHWAWASAGDARPQPRRYWKLPVLADGDQRPYDDEAKRSFGGNVNAAQRIELFFAGLAGARARLGARADDVRFVYRGNAWRRVRQMAEAAGVAELADVSGPVERERALALLTGADALLLLSIADPSREDVYFRRGFYPAKVFEYFGARRPILCVPGDRALLDELVARTRTGVVLPTPEAIAEHITRAVEAWREGTPCAYAPDPAELARYTRGSLTGELATILDAVVENRIEPPRARQPIAPARSSR
jgi:hypothetical protein